MLEVGDVLRTWAFQQLPRDWHVPHVTTAQLHADCPPISATNTVAAEQLADHRRDYLEFEGEISGNRGCVVRIAVGYYQMELDSPMRCRVYVEGDQIQGCLELTRANVGCHWLCQCSAGLGPSGQ